MVPSGVVSLAVVVSVANHLFSYRRVARHKHGIICVRSQES